MRIVVVTNAVATTAPTTFLNYDNATTLSIHSRGLAYEMPDEPETEDPRHWCDENERYEGLGRMVDSNWELWTGQGWRRITRFRPTAAKAALFLKTWFGTRHRRHYRRLPGSYG